MKDTNKKKYTFFEWSPPLAVRYLVWFSFTPQADILFDLSSDSLSAIQPEIFFRHIFWHSLRHSIWSDTFFDISFDILPGIQSEILFDMFSDIPSGILSDLTFCFTYILTFYLAFYLFLFDILCAIWLSQLGPGSAHWDLALVVGVRQCPLRSGPRGWGPAAPTVEIEAEGGRQREAGCTSDTFDKI